MQVKHHPLISLLAAAALCAPATSSILRVKSDAPGPTHDGTTWATAFLKVQDAVTSAHSGDEVWVAAGTYVENVQISAATPVSLYGGFTGTETARSQRYLGPSVTILDGGGLATVVAIRAAGVTVDGFTIRNGGGSPPFSLDPHVLELQGSGIACAADNLVVSHNVITGNTSHGGDLISDSGAGDGAGVFCSGNNALLDGNVINHNVARGTIQISYGLPGAVQTASGAGVYLSGAGAVVRGNTITDNTIDFYSNEPASDFSGAFSDNFSAFGGGVYCVQATIRSNIIARNAVTGVSWSRTSRGAVGVTGSAGGGGIFATGACSISGNLIYGNTVFANGTSQPAGVYCQTASALTNNTIVNNKQPNIYGSNADASDLGGSATGKNNIIGTSPDPLFVNAAAGDYHLQRTSPMIDAGDDSVVQPGDTDLDGNPRIRGAHVDMGAYELGPPLRVKWNAPGPTHDGSTWDTAYLTVASALAASYPGDEVWVAAGTYKEAVTLRAGRSLLGGFAGTEATASERDPAAHVTTLDANGIPSAVVTVMTKDLETATVGGFTLQGGYGYTTTVYGGCLESLCRGGIYDYYHNGGGVYVSGGAPTISNNRIVNNDTTYSYGPIASMYSVYTTHAGTGGGIYVAQGSALISHNFFSGNSAADGGGIQVEDGSPTIFANTIGPNNGGGISATGNLTITANTVSSNIGGGINIGGGNSVLTANTISGNNGYVCGGLHNDGGTCSLTDNVITDNRSPYEGGVYQNRGTLTLLHNTITNNYSANDCAGVSVSGTATLCDNLISGNTGYRAGGIELGTGTFSVLRNTITGNSSHEGGGVWCSANATLADNVIVHNSATGVAGGQATGAGGGVFVNPGASLSTVRILNNTIAGNTAAGGGGGIAVRSVTSGTAIEAGPVISNNIIASNGSGVASGYLYFSPYFGDGEWIWITSGLTPTFSHNCVFGNTAYDFQGVTDPTGTLGNLRANPQFADVTTGDFHLFQGSPCIDTGDDTYVQAGDTDLDGNPRIIGAHVDIGCYEYMPLMTAYVNAGSVSALRDGRSWSTAFQKVQDGINAVNPGGEVWVAKGTYLGNGIQVKPNVTLLGGFAGTENLATQRDFWKYPTILDGSADSNGYAPAPILEVMGGGVTVDGFTFRNGSEFTGPGSTGIPGAAIRYGNYPGRADAITISHNDIGSCNGSGIYCGVGSVPTIAWNKIHDNKGGTEGGGIRLNGSKAVIRENLIYANSVTSLAGGIRVYASSATITNNSIVKCPDGSAINIASFGQPVACVNNIVAYNGGGLGLDAGDASTITWRNNDVFGNTSWDFNGLQNPTGANGNIHADPLFANASGGDYHLKPGSPTIDTGDDSVVQVGDIDLDGKPRIVGTHVDMGAYEAPLFVRLADAAHALAISAGLATAQPGDLSSLDVVAGGSAGKVDILDAVKLLRMADGLG